MKITQIRSVLVVCLPARVPTGIDDASFSMRTSKNNKEESALVFFSYSKNKKEEKG